MLSEVIIPLMNVSRRCASGETVQEEVLNKSQIYITTAGWKGTFSYDKLIQILIWQILKPGTAAVLGGTWRKNMGCAKYKKQGERLVSGVLKVA